jgi:hypothetical protein
MYIPIIIDTPQQNHGRARSDISNGSTGGFTAMSQTWKRPKCHVPVSCHKSSDAELVLLAGMMPYLMMDGRLNLQQHLIIQTNPKERRGG